MICPFPIFSKISNMRKDLFPKEKIQFIKKSLETSPNPPRKKEEITNINSKNTFNPKEPSPLNTKSRPSIPIQHHFNPIASITDGKTKTPHSIEHKKQFPFLTKNANKQSTKSLKSANGNN